MGGSVLGASEGAGVTWVGVVVGLAVAGPEEAHWQRPFTLQGHQGCPWAQGAQAASWADWGLPGIATQESQLEAQLLPGGVGVGGVGGAGVVVGEAVPGWLGAAVTGGEGATVTGGVGAGVQPAPLQGRILMSEQDQNFSGAPPTYWEASRPPQVPASLEPIQPMCQSEVVIPAASFASKKDLYPAATQELPVM